MKQIILLFSFLFLLAFSAPAQQYYYWYQNQKIILKADSSVIYAEFANADSANIFLQKNAVTISRIGTVFHKTANSLLFTLKSSKELTLVSGLSSAFRFSSPLLRFKESSLIVVPRIIVELKKGYTISSLLSQYKDQLSLKDSMGHHDYLLNVNTNSFEDVVSIANKIYENNNNIEWCEPDFYNSFRVNDDPLYNQQYYLHNTGQNGGTPGIDIDAPGAWEITKGASTMISGSKELLPPYR